MSSLSERMRSYLEAAGRRKGVMGAGGVKGKGCKPSGLTPDTDSASLGELCLGRRKISHSQSLRCAFLSTSPSDHIHMPWLAQASTLAWEVGEIPPELGWDERDRIFTFTTPFFRLHEKLESEFNMWFESNIFQMDIPTYIVACQNHIAVAYHVWIGISVFQHAPHERFMPNSKYVRMYARFTGTRKPEYNLSFSILCMNILNWF
jgi:hypothetical protein